MPDTRRVCQWPGCRMEISPSHEVRSPLCIAHHVTLLVKARRSGINEDQLLDMMDEKHAVIVGMDLMNMREIERETDET